MGVIKEFKDFAIKGNVIDLAIGVVIGAAFGKIVNSLIEDVITPLILKPALDAAHLTKLSELTVLGSVKYGSFLAAVINFILVALTLFMIIKGINAAKKRDAAKPKPPVEPTKQELLLTEIRDLLAEKQK
ncbi:MAG: large conductance mechanosensitive channel protein MscL [Bacteroidetes bacterium]|jgi:large conductance mechanosensitive channel|nr:large conductance mechanosensitive channel protein MscL [Bacteroidota bacterium]